MSFGLSAGTIGLIGAGTTLASGLMGASAAGDAAAAQEAGAARSDATQRYFYDTNRADNAPFLANGTAASNSLAQRLGLGGKPGGAPAMTYDQARAQLLPQFTTTGAAAAGEPYYAATEAGGRWMNTDSTPSTSVNENGLKSAIEQLMQQNSGTADNSSPEYGSLLKKFDAGDLASDTVYNSGLQFGLSEGEKGIQRQAAATGSSLSGATLKALTRFGNDYATTKAGDAYNRYKSDQDSTYNKLAGVSGAGQVASAQVGSAGATAGSNISQSQQGVGNARAAGYIGTANALGGGLTGGVSAYQNNQLLNRVFPQGSTGYSGATGYSGNSDPLGDMIAANKW